MNFRSVCRRCTSELNRDEFGAKAGAHRSFLIAGARAHYAPDLPFRTQHIFLDVEVDPVGKTIKGLATQKFKTIAPAQTSIRLDQIGLAIEEVLVDGKKADFVNETGKLVVVLGNAPAVGSEVEVSVRYSAHDPRRGIYFTGPDADRPQKKYQVWTQGQDEDSRHWFPTFDYPNQKATSEIRALVPKGYTAVSNGALLSKKDVGGKTQFHYKIGTPHVTYLVSLVVGEYSEWEDKGPRDLPVQYFVQPGREADGKRSFSNTPRMIAAFEKKTGIPYPYEKYSQVAVQDFIFGGMENTSSTTQTDQTLHDERAALDFTSDYLVAHELAHQWFGDLLTCRDWSHGWLNEGFATFMERVWIENDPGPRGGIEEAKYYSYCDLKEHIEEDERRYRRPIVCNTYLEPMDLFDTHLYQKGGLVVNLLRSLLGEDQFWKAINHYVTTNREKNVETLDLIRAIEETTGRNLRRFFDEWVFNAGYPEFEVSYQWHEEKKLAEMIIEQKQTGGKSELVQDGSTTKLFHLPVSLEFTFEGGKKASHTLTLGEPRERVFISLASKPLMVRFDSGFTIPKTLKFPRSKELLLYQLRNDSDCMGRIEAAIELGKIADPEVIAALGDVALKDVFWGVQGEVAEVLSQIRTDQARDVLIKALATPLPKARREIVRALGTFKDDQSAAALKKLAEKDPSYLVEAQATSAWAEASLGVYTLSGDVKVEQAEQFLIKQLEKTSYREVIRAAALQSLSKLPGVHMGERPKALQTIMDWTKRTGPDDARVAAIGALGKLAQASVISQQKIILQTLSQLADEESFRIRMALVVGLAATENAHAVEILSKIRSLEIDPRVRRNALAAIDALQTSGGASESVMKLKSALEKVEEDQKKLRSLFEEAKKPQ